MLDIHGSGWTVVHGPELQPQLTKQFKRCCLITELLKIVTKMVAPLKSVPNSIDFVGVDHSFSHRTMYSFNKQVFQSVVFFVFFQPSVLKDKKYKSLNQGKN